MQFDLKAAGVIIAGPTVPPPAVPQSDIHLMPGDTLDIIFTGLGVDVPILDVGGSKVYIPQGTSVTVIVKSTEY